MKRKPALLLALSLYSVPPSVSALGLGDIELRSSLNQPLDARIALKSWRPGELEDLKVNLAGREHFDRAGMERIAGLSDLKFQVVEASEESAYIEVSTKSDFKEPFLDFLIEVSWPQGRVLREYTLLVDPPLYAAAVAESLTRPSAMSTVERSVEAVAKTSPKLISEPSGATDSAASNDLPSGRQDKVRQDTEQASASAGAAPATEVTRALTYGPTTTGDTLWQVASEIVGDSSEDLNRLMLALFRKNPDAFLEQNMNLLKKGVVLQIPDQAATAAIRSSEALAELRRHHVLWEEYRQTVAARSDGMPTGEVPGTEMTSISQGENERTVTGARVKLVSAGSANAGVGNSADTDSVAEELRNELALASEDAEAAKRENQDLSERLGDAENIIKDLRRLIDLKDDTISSLQQQLAAANTDFEASGVESVDDVKVLSSNVSDAETTAPIDGVPVPEARAEAEVGPNTLYQEQTAEDAAPEAVGAVEPQLSAPPKVTGDKGLATDGSSVSEEQVQQMAPTHAGAAIGVGLFGGLLVAGSGFAMWRRRRVKAAELMDTGEPLLEGDAAAADLSDSVASDAEKPALTDVGTVESSADPAEVDADQGETMLPHDTEVLDDDPLAEVNVYLAYERFEQAEQLVKEAIEKYPSRQEYKLKLLEIFALSKDAGAFKTHARALRDAVGDDNPLTEKALEWWRDLCPDQDLFAEELSEQEVFAGQDNDDEVDVSGGALVDFHDGVDESVGSDTVHLKPGERTAPDRQSASEMELDFDLGTGLVGGENTSERTEGTVDFDLGLEGMSTDDDRRQQDELDLALSEYAPDDRGTGHKETTGTALDFDLDDEMVGSKGAAEATIDFDLGGFELAGSGSLSFDDSAEQLAADETVDLDYSFGENKDEEPADGPKALDRNKIPEEGTVDFDLGLADASETDPMKAVESVEPAMSWDAQLTEERGEESVGPGMADDGLFSEVTPDSGDDSAPVTQDALGDQALSSEHEGADMPVGWREDANAIDGLDLEIEPDEASSVVQSDDMVGDDDAASNTSTSMAIESLPEDKLLDEWAELEGESGDEADRTLVLGRDFSQDLDEIQTKLELAQAYIDMGDTEGARSILDEVMSEGDADQKQAARELIDKMA